MKRLKFAAIALGHVLSFALVHAQDAAAVSAAESANGSQLNVQVMQSSAALFAAGRDGDAVNALSQIARQPADSPLWHLQMAQRYIQLAQTFFAAADQNTGSMCWSLRITGALTCLGPCREPAEPAGC